MTKWQWIFRQFGKKLWVRVSLFGVGAVVTAVLAPFFRDYIPDDISRRVGAESVDKILQIIASTMLAVTTFSLSTMVVAYVAVSNSATPRATKLLLEDRTAQNALATFIGSFIFALVGIIALTMNVYGVGGRLILFAVTVLVIAVIVVVLIQWINYLSVVGRVAETVGKVEVVVRGALTERLTHPYLDATPLLDDIPAERCHLIYHDEIGYVQYIDMVALSSVAEAHDVDIYVQALPGKFNDTSGPVAFLLTPPAPDLARAVAAAFVIGADRSFEQDPRFGLIVLSEIASRAMSPAVNDPGTAIDVIGTGVRLLAPWVQREERTPDIRFERIHVPPLQTRDLFDDFFTPIARDGAGAIEVAIRLQKALLALSRMGNPQARAEANRHRALALKRAMHVLVIDEDRVRLETLAHST